MTASPAPSPRSEPDSGSVEQRLYERPGRFGFFQAVSLLERIARKGADDAPAIRFETPASTAFPASEVESIEPAAPGRPARMRVSFMGLTGPSGVLPRHYTTKLIELERRLRGDAKRALHAWFDLFSGRFIGHFYKAWRRRRIDEGVAQGAADRLTPDRFTAALHSLAGVGTPALRDRLIVRDQTDEWVLDRVNDQALARYAAILGRRRRPAEQIAALLSDYFQAPVTIKPFRGQWLTLDPSDRTQLGAAGQANRLGVDAVAGARVWDIQSRVRICVGPLERDRFIRFLPEDRPGSRRRRFQCLCQLARLALGPEIDFDVQLILKGDGVPRLKAGAETPTRLGWDTWLGRSPLGRDGHEPVFEPIESTSLAG